MSAKAHPSSLLFYFVAAALGVSFSAVLVVLAWNNVVQNETRNFAFDAIAAQNSLEGNVRTADAVIDNLASFVAASSAADTYQFRSYTTGTLQRYAFISGLSHGRIGADGTLTLIDAASTYSSATLRNVVQSEDAQRIIRQGLTSGSAAISVVGGRAGSGPEILFLLQPVAGSVVADGEIEIVVLAIDLAQLVGAIVVDPTLNLALYTESEGAAGRRLIYSKAAQPARTGIVVETLSDDSTVRLDGFSVRLLSSKDVFWGDLDRDILFVALFLGLGVTLLLVALARAKDIQARELQARNRVIEEQVNQQTRELAEARDHALEASRVKSDFLASMSHEIRTPLNAIIGMADLLAETRLDDEQENYVGVFRNAGEALLSLVNDILDLSKIEADQLTLESIDFDLFDIVEQAAEIYALKADAKDIDLVTVLAPGLPRRVTGDPGRIRQIVLNLIGNAIKFTEAGQIVVRVAPLESSAGGSMIRFEVADSGIGIPPGKLDSIFSNFTQVDSSITRKYGGTGLGLAICKRLVEIMGGRIWAESNPGRGSSFKFDVKLLAGEAEDVAAPAFGSLGRVLIVESNQYQGEALRDFFSARGVKAVLTARPSEGFAELERGRDAGKPYELVVLDSGGDVVAAVDCVTRLRAERSAIPVVTLFRPSSLAQGVEGLRGIANTTFVIKPIRQAQFVKAVERARAGADNLSSEASPASEESLRPARILLVEDNPDNRLLVKAYLKQQPYELVEAENGEEAVAAYKASAFDLVLMDVQMPVMDGYAATRSIRSWEADQHRAPTPIIALTANAVKEDIESSRKAGCDDHLTKPIKKQTLVTALRERLAAARPV